MGQFLTPVKMELLIGQFREGRQLWRVVDNDVRYACDLLCEVITVPVGFVTDLASVPKRPLEWWLAGGQGNAAALLHDLLYTTHSVNGRPVTRAQADAVLREAIGATEPSAPGWLMWAAVRVGGSSAWDATGPIQPDHIAEWVSGEQKYDRAGA